MIAVPAVVSKLGMWWPDGDPDALNAAALDWETFAQAMEPVRLDAQTAAWRLAADQEGRAILACTESFADFTRDLDTTIQTALDQAKTLREYAQHVEHTQHMLIEMAIAAATVIAACSIGALITAGASEGGAAVATAAVCSAAEAVGFALSNTAATIVAGAIEAALIDVVIQEGRIHILHEGGFSWTELGLSAGLGVLASGVAARLFGARGGPGGSTISAAVDAKLVTVYRVEAGDYPKVFVNAEGRVAISKKRTVFLNFGDPVRAESFLVRRLEQGNEGTVLKTFEVRREFVETLRSTAVPESMARRFPQLPFVVDTTKAADQYGLRRPALEELERHIIQGSGRVHGHG